MPTEHPEAPHGHFMFGPVPIYFTRLPDDERDITKIVVGVLARGPNKVWLRGYWSPDDWDKWKLHPWFQRPTTLYLTVSQEAPGLVVRVDAIVPLRELPRDQWGPEWEGEEWNNQVPPGDALGTLPLGILVRYERAFKYGGHLLRESLDVLNNAITGKSVEPWEQGLGA